MYWMRRAGSELPLCPVVGFGREDKEREEKEKDKEEEKEEEEKEKTELEKEKDNKKEEEEKVGEDGVFYRSAAAWFVREFPAPKFPEQCSGRAQHFAKRLMLGAVLRTSWTNCTAGHAVSVGRWAPEHPLPSAWWNGAGSCRKEQCPRGRQAAGSSQGS